MSTRDLCQNPLWEGNELGRPIPESPHAVSVALPRWQDVTGYEEGRPDVIEKLATGYPRFVVHSLVRALASRLGGEGSCLPFPSLRVAELCADFIRRSSGEAARIVSGHGVHGVVTSDAGSPCLKAFWQHTGLIVSSRQAETILTGRRNGGDATAIRRSLRQQLAGFYDCAPDDVFLTPSGMAAQFAALQVVRGFRPGRPTAQLGFPYVEIGRAHV
jgi:cystathionine gamma-synthase